MPKPKQEPLLTVRAALIILLALTAGATATVLACLARNPLPGALLIGGSATGGALLLFNSLIGRLEPGHLGLSARASPGFASGRRASAAGKIGLTDLNAH